MSSAYTSTNGLLVFINSALVRMRLVLADGYMHLIVPLTRAQVLRQLPKQLQRSRDLSLRHLCLQPGLDWRGLCRPVTGACGSFSGRCVESACLDALLPYAHCCCSCAHTAINLAPLGQ